MRDSFGGVFMLNLFLVFIFIYVAFSAVSLTYAKAFRVKNKVIDFIETNEIVSLSTTSFTTKLEEELKPILNSLGYNVACEGENGPVDKTGTTVNSYCYEGVTIEIQETQTIAGTTSKIIKYNVYTKANWNLGALNKILALGGKKQNSEDPITGTWTITGEAKVVSKG